jgi:DNA invertase Pin-like site-specific DNA recombinase
VSTADRHVRNQQQELIRYVEARGWTLTREYADSGVSGAAQSRPALDEMLRDAKRRRFDAVIVWSLDRLGRNLST